MSLDLVPTSISLLLLHERETIMLEMQFVFGNSSTFSFLNSAFQMMIFPVLSPEMKEEMSYLLAMADTDPVCPGTALTHSPLSQK